MSEKVYARLARTGQVEIVLRREGECQVFRVPDAAFAALFEIVVSAARHRLASPPSRAPAGDAADGLIWTPWGLMEDKDKSARRYGKRA